MHHFKRDIQMFVVKIERSGSLKSALLLILPVIWTSCFISWLVWSPHADWGIATELSQKENFPTYLWMLNLPPKGLSAKFKSERESEIRNKEMGGREERKWKESWERERERDKFSREWKSDFWIWRFGHESVCVVGFTADHSSRWSVSTLACCLVSSIFTFAFKSERHPLFWSTEVD